MWHIRDAELWFWGQVQGGTSELHCDGLSSPSSPETDAPSIHGPPDLRGRLHARLSAGEALGDKPCGSIPKEPADGPEFWVNVGLENFSISCAPHQIE